MAGPAETAQSGLIVEQFGELVAVHYDPEDEVALFLEGSAEVLNCSKAEWLAFRERLSGPLSDLSSAAPGADGERLKELLQTLGVSIA